MNIDALVRYYETLSPESVEQMGRFYADGCWFKDPFNEVRGLPEIQAIFRRMYRHLAEPRFKIAECIAGGGVVALTWDFEFRMKAWRPGAKQCIRGATVLKFDGAGKVAYHRDYWDAAEELYEKLPGIGFLMRALRRRLR